MLSLFSVIFRKCENLSEFLLGEAGCRCLLVLVGDGLCCHLGLRGGGDDVDDLLEGKQTVKFVYYI